MCGYHDNCQHAQQWKFSRDKIFDARESHSCRDVWRLNMGVSAADTSRESVRERAIGMIGGGCTQRQVAERLSLALRTVNTWWRRFVQGERLGDRPRSGRPTKVSRVAKIVCAKAANKKGQSVRKLATRLSRKGYQVSKSTVHRYMRHSLGLKAYRRTKQPKNS